MKIQHIHFGQITLVITAEEAHMIARGCHAAACHLYGSAPNKDAFAHLGEEQAIATLYEQAEAAFDAYVLIADLSSELKMPVCNFYIDRLPTRGFDARPAPDDLAHPKRQKGEADDAV